MLPTHPDSEPFLLGVVNEAGTLRALSQQQVDDVIDGINSKFVTDQVCVWVCVGAPLYVCEFKGLVPAPSNCMTCWVVCTRVCGCIRDRK